MSVAAALVAGATGFVGVLGHLYGIESFYRVLATSMPAHAGVLLIIAAVGALSLNPRAHLVGAVLDPSDAGSELRRWLPGAILLPSLLGALAALGERAGWYDARFGAALLAVTCAGSLVGIALISYGELKHAAAERDQARVALAASEARYRSTFERASVGIAHIGPDGRWLRANDRLCAMLGYAPDELLSKTVAEVSHLEDLPIDATQWELLRRGEIQDYAVERRFWTKTGEIVYADVRLAREEDEAGELRHVIVVLQDITSRKRSESALRVYERAVAATQNGIVITDARRDDHPIVYANPAFLKITGYSAGDLAGRNCRLLNKNARGQAALEELRRAIRDEEACSVLLRNHRMNGEAFWNQLSIAPVHDAGGHLTHFVGVVIDATERMQVLAEREEILAATRSAQREAEAANEAKDRFLSVVSHELRSPMSAIQAWVALLRDEADEKSVTRALEAIEAALRSQTRLVDDLLDASRMRARTLEIEPVRIDLAATLRGAVERFGPIAAERRIELAFHSAVDRAPCLADALRIAQVVHNLVDNALKFTPAGGRVDVALSGKSEAWIVEVRDTGRGIPAEQLEHVFAEFWQGDRREGGRGLGLGLAIVKHLVELHGGTVQVESDGPGQGAVFRVELPRLSQEVVGSPAPPRPVRPLQSVAVLVVEDDEATLEALAIALERAGAVALRARSYAEGLRALAEAPDVLVSDIGLPDRDGLELIHAVRSSEEPATRAVPALAVTARVGVHERGRILLAGFDAYLAKPVDPSAVVERIVALRERQARGELHRDADRR
jgi:PAS domain S-box-containing protein